MIDVTLPWPPTGNHYKKPRVTGQGIRWYLTAEAKVYHESVWAATRGKSSLGGLKRLSVAVTLHPPDRRRFDLDNRVKVLLDSMQHAGVYADDAQIDHLEIVRGEVRKPGVVIVHLEAIPVAPGKR